MKKVSYIGNGKIREFYFNFPYYENSNIVVTMNGAAATGIEVIGNQGGLDADFPFIGGCVVFNTAPRDTDTITIARVLPLSRVVDYQQMVRIDPHTLNMDINYIKEIIDDLSDEIHEMAEQSKPDEIREMLEKIDALNARIDALGDISDIRDNIATNTDDIATNRDNIATNTENIANLKDAANFSATGKQEIVSFGIPDYSNGINIFHAARTTGFSAPTNGFISACQTPATSAYEITIDNHIVSSKTATQSPYSGCFFGAIAQGSVVKTTMPENVAGIFMFFPTK